MSSSSSVSGVMSKQIIMSGDDVVLYLLMPSSKMGYYLNKGQRTLISNEGSEVIYNPIALPIIGTCGDFGQLLNIVRDDNVLEIEKTLGVSIETVLSRVGDDRNSFSDDPIIEKIMDKVSSCMEHREIFDAMVKTDAEKRSYRDSHINSAVLSLLGFTVTDDKLEGRYYKKYEHKDLDNVVIFSDNWSVEVLVDGEKASGCYDIGGLLEVIDLDITNLKGETDTSLYIKYAEIISELVVYKDKDPRADEIMKKIRALNPETDFGLDSIYGELFNELKALEKESNIGKLTEDEKDRNDGYLSTVNCAKGKLELLNKKSVFKQDRKSLEAHFHFGAAMQSTSSIWMPTLSGYNDCDGNYGKELYKAMEKFVR